MTETNNGFLRYFATKQNLCFFGFLLCELCFLALICFMQINEDEIEHIHASWLVWEGYVPYRDFFEHHNPLLWYLFAPITALFYDNANIVYFVNFLALIINSINIYIIYKMLQRCSQRAPLVLCLTLIFCLAIAPEGRESFVTFRPDMFMNLCFFGGVLAFLRYTENHKRSNLILSFVLFTLSFFFLQKIAILLICIGLEILYCLYKKIILPRDFLLSLILPVLLCGGFAIYLTVYNLWSEYFLLNVEFNSLMLKHWGLSEYILKIADISFIFDVNFGYGGVSLAAVTKIIIILALMSLPAFVKQGNIYIYTISYLFIAELFSRMFIFSPHMYYFLILHILAALILFTVVCRQMTRIVIALISILFILYWFININLLVHSKTYISNMNIKMNYFRYVIDNSKPDDIILSGYQYPINLFRRDADYTWFLLADVGNIYNQYYRHDKFDINKIIREKKPKIIIITDGRKTFLQQRMTHIIKKYNRDILKIMSYTKKDYSHLLFHPEILQNNMFSSEIDEELLHRYYEPAPINDLWLRKSKVSE